MPKYKIIKDCDGNLLYKKEIETDEHFRDLRRRQIDYQKKVGTRDESLVGDWEYSFYLPRYILRKIDRNFSQGSQYRKQYKCNECGFTDHTMGTIQVHLRDFHSIDADNMHDFEKCCHACRKTYNELYKAERYDGWDDSRRRTHHWAKCKQVQERIKSHIPAQFSDYKENVFDTTTLPIDTRYELLSWFEKKYISNKHVYSECQIRYIDTITTAYHSDIMKGVLSHDN